MDQTVEKAITRDTQQIASSLSFPALTHFSLLSSPSKKKDRTENRGARSHSARLPSLVNELQKTLLEASVLGQQQEDPALAPPSQTNPGSLARDTAVTAAGDKLSYAAFAKINPTITDSATWGPALR